MNRIACPSGATRLAFLPDVCTITHQYKCALYFRLVRGLGAIEVCHCLVHDLVEVPGSALLLGQSWDLGCMVGRFKAEVFYHARAVLRLRCGTV